jgi:hypothetical protein
MKLYWLGLVGAFFGFTLRFYDRFMIRGAEISFSFIENRHILDNTGPSVYGALGSILYGFAYIPLFIVLYAQYSGYELKKFYIILAYVIFTFPIIDNIIVGSRLQVVIAIFIYLMYIIIYGKGKIKKMFITFLSIIFILLISIIIFSIRSDQLGFNLQYSIMNSVYAQFVKPRVEVMSAVKSLPNYLQLLSYGMIHLLQYFVHGIYEFSYLIDHNDGTVITFGTMMFEPVFKLLKIFGFYSNEYNNMFILRSGVYTTFWGPLYIDFGWYSILIMFIMGFLSEHFYLLVSKYNIYYYTPLYVYMSIIIFFMPVVNLLSVGLGVYIITSYIIIVVIGSLLSINLRSQK